MFDFTIIQKEDEQLLIDQAVINHARKTYLEVLEKHAANPNDFYVTINCLKDLADVFRNLFGVIKFHIEQKRIEQKKMLSSCFSCFSSFSCFALFTSNKKPKSKELSGKTSTLLNIIERIKKQFFSGTETTFKSAFDKDKCGKHLKISNFIYSQTHPLKEYEKGTFANTTGQEQLQILFLDGTTIEISKFDAMSLSKLKPLYDKKMYELEKHTEEMKKAWIKQQKISVVERISYFIFLKMPNQGESNKIAPTSYAIRPNHHTLLSDKLTLINDLASESHLFEYQLNENIQDQLEVPLLFNGR